MVEPRDGRIPFVLAFGYTAAVSAAWYWTDHAPALLFPVFVSALPLAATSARQGFTLRVITTVLLWLWAALVASVGLSYLPAAFAMLASCVKAETVLPRERDAKSRGDLK